MRGYDDSVAGDYLPPGRAMDRLPVYDLNRIQDVPERGRAVPVPDGANFQAITLHKAIVGGEPSDAADRRDYPGCVLLSLPKMKVHNIALFTNAIKNLGIGLYPMEAASDGDPASTRWMYSSPQTAGAGHEEPPAACRCGRRTWTTRPAGRIPSSARRASTARWSTSSRRCRRRACAF